MFLLQADKNKLTFKELDILTSGSINVYLCRFSFSYDWKNLDKTAVFRAGEKRFSVRLDNNDECVIPWEVVDKDCEKQHLLIGVYGIRGEDVVLPTIWADAGTIQEGTRPGGHTKAPTPDIYRQILAELDGKVDSAEYDDENLILRSGEKEISRIPWPSGAELEIATDEDFWEMMGELFPATDSE